MRVQVTYSVPVIAIVDLDKGVVDRVIVADEEVHLDETAAVVENDGLTAVDMGVARRAIEIAEDDGDEGWPAWEFGF